MHTYINPGIFYSWSIFFDIIWEDSLQVTEPYAWRLYSTPRAKSDAGSTMGGKTLMVPICSFHH